MGKYTVEVSAQKIKERINYLLNYGAPQPLKRELVINGFGFKFNARETDVIDFKAGFDFLEKSRAIKFVDKEAFEITEYFERLTPSEYAAPRPLSIIIDEQIKKEAANMQQCYRWLHIFENSLRNLVKDSLTEKYGARWYDELTERVKREIKRNKEGWRGGIPPRNDLEFTLLSTLHNIINSNWKAIFQDKFKNTNLTSLGESLQKIEEFRNTIAHTRMLTEEEFRLFYDEIGRVLSSIK